MDRIIDWCPTPHPSYQRIAEPAHHGSLGCGPLPIHRSVKPISIDGLWSATCCRGRSWGVVLFPRDQTCGAGCVDHSCGDAARTRVSRRRRSSNASAKNAAKAGSSGSRYFGDAIGPLTTRINKIHAIRRRRARRTSGSRRRPTTTPNNWMARNTRVPKPPASKSQA